MSLNSDLVPAPLLGHHFHLHALGQHYGVLVQFGLLVLAHVMQQTEVLVAIIAAVQFDVRVDELVLGQGVSVGKRFVAHLAHVGLDATVNTDRKKKS